jgi:hypothetical protein
MVRLGAACVVMVEPHDRDWDRAILQNEEDFPEPTAFKPERFLHPDGRLNRTVTDPASVAFGFGRR